MIQAQHDIVIGVDEWKQVRALIDAKIAARELQIDSAIRWRRSSASQGEPKERFRGWPPNNLQVPSSLPHPPDLHAANLSFAARIVIAVRDRFGGNAPRVYEAARVTRAAYSQIISDETHKVSKRTVIRFAFALHLNPEETRLLLKSAGYAFSHSLTEDFILESCLETNPPIYDFDSINSLLREYHVNYQY